MPITATVGLSAPTVQRHYTYRCCPGITGDSPEWRDKDLSHVLARTPTKRLVTMADVVDATVFLLENPAMNGENLHIDGGWMLM